MAFMLDENVPHPILKALKSLGVDAVLFHGPPASGDEDVPSASFAAGRTLITYDKDFGDLIFRKRESAAGVVLVRWDIRSPSEAIQIAKHIRSLQDFGRGQFSVVSESGLRTQFLP